MSKSSRARTRAVRQQMEESGAPYTRAAREVGDPTEPPKQNRTDLVRAHIQTLLSDLAQDTRRRVAEIQALEGQGHRIVSGGQTGPYSWEVVDWRTRQILAQGDDGLQGYDAATDSLDPDGTWIHIDHVAPEPSPLPLTSGIPESLSSALEDWTCSPRTSDEEIAEFIGWPEEKVRDHRRE